MSLKSFYGIAASFAIPTASTGVVDFSAGLTDILDALQEIEADPNPVERQKAYEQLANQCGVTASQLQHLWATFKAGEVR